MAGGGVQTRVVLPPTPESARDARRFVSEVLSTAHASDFADAATLLTSELVTNGIVHAQTDLQIVIEATSAWVRVEVSDTNPHLPVRREYDRVAATGRGLEMVELLADDFGVEPIDAGKRVWFRLGVVPGTPSESVAAADEDPFVAVTPLRLRNLPVQLYCAWQQHADALLREAMLLSYDEGEQRGDYGLASSALGAIGEAAQQIFALRDEEVSSADVYLDVASDAVPWFPILREMLRQATQQALAGQMLTPPSLPEIVGLRNWICDEMARQSAGLSPTPWSELEHDDSGPLKVSKRTLTAIRKSTQALVAADGSNRIVAVSAGAAQMLGWEPQELEGRRLVSIIPPRLRDRHIAGFTRHLLEGTQSFVGRDVEVPALRRDGSEVVVIMRIEKRVDPATRALFVATLLPRVAPATD